MYYNPPRRLTNEEMTVNANYIYSFLLSKGWTKNAIAGILGNMQSESSINPNRWQSDNIGNLQGGYGLTQWTPATKLMDWCADRNLDCTTMDANLARILYEVDLNAQWGANVNIGSPPYNFEGFTQSTETPYTLAVNFLWFYERPQVQSVEVQQERGSQAEHWYTVLTGQPIDPNQGFTIKHTYKIYDYVGKRRYILK
jgi:hypothetical protein